MRLHLQARLILMIAVGGCDTAPRNDQPTRDVIIPLKPYFRDLRTVEAVVGRDSLTLLLDTGGGATVIAPAVAQRLGCHPYGRDLGHRMTGEPVEFQRCDSVSMDLAGWPRRLAPIGVYDVNALLPPALPPLDGVLALDAFRGQILTIDWPGRRLIIHSATTGAHSLEALGVPVRTATGPSGASLTLFARIEGRRGFLWFLIDSGDLRGTLIDSHVYRDSLLITRGDSVVELRVGARSPLMVAAQRGDFIIDGVLGTDFLQRGALTLDLRGRTP